MNEQIIEFEPLLEGILIKRYKRFLADIQIDNGEIVTAHCPNTGPMKGLIKEGAKVRISFSSSKKSASKSFQSIEFKKKHSQEIILKKIHN